MKGKRFLSGLLAAALSANMVIASGFTAYANEPETEIEIIEETSNAPAEEVSEPEAAPVQETAAPSIEPAPVQETQSSPVEPATPVQEDTPSSIEPAAADQTPSETPAVVSETPTTESETFVAASEPAVPAQEDATIDAADLRGGSSEKVIDPQYTDADKYMAEGYDEYLCWAATAANMLWGSSYAPNTLNPITGDYFHNEDEVFDYFRKCFTDEAGVPDGAIEYFFKGTYQYAGDEGCSQLREDAPRGGMMPHDEKLYDVIIHTTTTNVLDTVADLSKKTAGALLKWWIIDQERTAAELGAHWLTIAQVVMNENGGYQGIWLADSDNDPASEDPQYAGITDPAERASAAANMPNSYTYYDLSYEQLGDVYYWVVNDFLNYSNLKTYLFAIAYLNDLRQGGGGDPSEIDYGDDEEDTADTADTADMTDMADTTDEIPQYTQEEIRQVVLNEIKSMMVEKEYVVFSPTKDVYDKSSNTDYTLIVRRLFTSLANVYIDGIRLEQAGVDYTIQQEPNGLFSLIISKEYMQTLEPGTYTITLEFDGSEPVTCTLTVK